jgi:hypothetical protein
LAVAFLTHTTNIFQVLDLVFFSALKKLETTADGEFKDNAANDQITEVIQADRHTVTSITIRSSFRRPGMPLDSSIHPFRSRLNEESLRENPRVPKIWDCDVKIEELARKRQTRRFGIMNSEFTI